MSLSPGSLNDIRLEITEPGGVTTVIEKSILGTSALLPKGGFMYFTGAGTDRETDEWQTRGTFAGARGFYGITNHLTAGVTTAYQKDFFEPVTSLSDIGDRQYPDSSLHLGFQASWKPTDCCLLSGDMAWVSGNEGRYDETDSEFKSHAGFNDRSFKIDGLFFPKTNLDFEVLAFWYGPEFFNGANKDLRDRKGYVLNTEWRASSKIVLFLAGGSVRDNVENQRDETLLVDFQSAQTTVNLIPKTSLTFLYDRFSPDWEKEDKNLLTLEFRTTLLPGITTTGEYSRGEDLRFDEEDQFLQGLRLPGISLYGSRNTSVSMRKKMRWGGNIGVRYRETDTTEEASVTYTDTIQKWIPIELKIEAGYNMEDKTPLFESRLETPVGRSRKTRGGIHVEYDNEEWKAEVYFTLTELFSFIGGRPQYISGSRISPDNGAICGKVFLDRNADGVMDSDEKGVSYVEVLLNNRRRVETDKDGNFVFPSPGNVPEVHMNVNPESIPAIYSCTHGQQEAILRKGEITLVNFGVAPVNAVTGYVFSENEEKKMEPMIGTRLFVLTIDGSKQIAESVTAGDGSYYLQDIRPGKYVLRFDEKTIPKNIVIKGESPVIDIAPSDDLQEINLPDIIFIHEPKKFKAIELLQIFKADKQRH